MLREVSLDWRGVIEDDEGNKCNVDDESGNQL